MFVVKASSDRVGLSYLSNSLTKFEKSIFILCQKVQKFIIVAMRSNESLTKYFLYCY